MAFLMDFGQFLGKLNKINWSKIDKTLGKVLSSEDGWELSYRIEEMDSLHADDFPLQVLVYLKFEGEHVQTWGCETNKENADFLKYFKTKRYEVQKELDLDRRTSENVGKEKFLNL